MLQRDAGACELACLGNFRSITPCAREKYLPDNKGIASNCKTQVVEEEGVGIDMEWTCSLVSLTC